MGEHERENRFAVTRRGTLRSWNEVRRAPGDWGGVGAENGAASRTSDRGACFCSHRAGGSASFSEVPRIIGLRPPNGIESVVVLLLTQLSCRRVLLFSFKTAGINPAQLSCKRVLLFSFQVVACFLGFRHSGDATHASGRQGVRYAEPNGRFGISTTLYPPVRSGSRGFCRLTSVIFTGSSYKKNCPGWCFRRRADRAQKKKAQTTAPARGGGRGMSVGAREVLQTALMGLFTALGQRNRPKWTSRAVSRGGFFATTQTQTTGFLIRG